jgi:hypothetical protein
LPSRPEVTKGLYRTTTHWKTGKPTKLSLLALLNLNLAADFIRLSAAMSALIGPVETPRAIAVTQSGGRPIAHRDVGLTLNDRDHHRLPCLGYNRHPPAASGTGDGLAEHWSPKRENDIIAIRCAVFLQKAIRGWGLLNHIN